MYVPVLSVTCRATSAKAKATPVSAMMMMMMMMMMTIPSQSQIRSQPSARRQGGPQFPQGHPTARRQRKPGDGGTHFLLCDQMALRPWGSRFRVAWFGERCLYKHLRSGYLLTECGLWFSNSRSGTTVTLDSDSDDSSSQSSEGSSTLFSDESRCVK